MTQTATKPGITAEAHSDDRVFEVPFDANKPSKKGPKYDCASTTRKRRPNAIS